MPPTRAKQPTLERSMDESIILEINRSFNDPTMFFNWSEGLEKAQKVGRIKRSKLSPLAYCLTKYIQARLYASVLEPNGEGYGTCHITVDDLEFEINWARGAEKGCTVANIPEWLFYFFDNDEAMQYLDPSDETNIMDLLQVLYEDALARGYIGKEGN